MVFVAAGGGGDALATAMLHFAMTGGSDDAVIATYAWDRLLIDPLPGHGDRVRSPVWNRLGITISRYRGLPRRSRPLARRCPGSPGSSAASVWSSSTRGEEP